MGLVILLAAIAPQDSEIEALVRELAAEEPEVRDRAQRRLVELGARSRPAMLRAARGRDPETAGRARHVLRAYPPEVRMEELHEAGFRRETAAALPNFAARIWSGNPEAVAAAAREAGPKAKPEDLRALVSVLEREGMHETVRQAFADLLESRRDAALAPAVVPLLAHPNSWIRERSLRALVAAGAKEHAPAILPLLLDRDSVHKALEALERLGSPVPEDAIRDMLAAPDEGVRFNGVRLARSRDLRAFRADLVQALLVARSCEPWSVEDAVARSGPAWEDLQPLFESDHGPVRLAALRLSRRLRLPETLEAAVRLLDDLDEEVRKEAIHAAVAWGGPEPLKRAAEGRGPGSLLALARLGAPAAKGKALAALESPEPPMRQAALTALRVLDAHEEASRIEPLLEDPAAEVRAEAARVLPHLAGDAIGPKIAARLSKEDHPKVQAALLGAVVETACAEAAPHVLRLLDDAGDAVRWQAARAAGALRLREAVPALVRRRSYEPLLQLRPENLVDLLRGELKSPPEKPKDDRFAWKERQEVDRHNDGVLYLLYVNPPGAREFLIECLRRGIVPRHPIESIRFLRAVDAFPWVIEEMEKADRAGMSGAGRLLAAWGRKDLADRALAWLSSRSSETRYAGIELLGGLGLEEKIPAVAALLDSPETQTQWAAWSVLAWIGGPRTVEVFRRRVREGTPMNRANAALLLGREKDARSIPEIEPLLDEEDAEVRETAAEALASMRASGSFERIVRAYERGSGKDVRDWHWHLVLTGGARGRGIVAKDLEHPVLNVRENAMRAMGWGEGFLPEEAERVEAYLYDFDVGDEAREALARVDPARLLRHVEDPRKRFFLGGGNWASVLLERTVGPPAAISALTRLLEDGDENNRWHAAEVLARWGAQEAVEPLARYLHADDRYAPTYAAVALARLGDARGLELILKLPRQTTPAQGRMKEALLALNGIRHPEAFRKAASVSWERESGWYPTLEEAVTELARRAGMKIVFSGEITELDRRTPLDWPRRSFDLDMIASTWSTWAAFVIEPGEIRVMPPEAALRFWEEWARRRK